MAQRKIIIVGAAGRDFHDFNRIYRGCEDTRVVAFTAAQIPDIDGRAYPAELAGPDYPEGIPIVSEDRLADVIDEHGVDEVVFAYSDVSYEKVMRIGAIAQTRGAGLRLSAPKKTMVKSTKPVVSICAVRTGCGKSQTTRAVAGLLRGMGFRLVAVRHPMPYGDLARQKVQRFAKLDDLVEHRCTIEEIEEYEPHLASGTVVYAGVDYEAILRHAEQEADVILWDGGNNDLPFYKSDLEIVVVDPLRAGNELGYYPGEANLRRARVVVINKIDSASREQVETVRRNIAAVNPRAVVVDAASPVTVEDPGLIRGKRCLVVEDGPTLTHGEMTFGAGTVAASRYGAREIVDPRPWLQGTLLETYRNYPGIGCILPAMGYGEQQLADLRSTIDAVECDTVIVGTPIDLKRYANFSKPSVRVGYDLQEIGRPTLAEIVHNFVAEKGLKK